MKGTTTHRGPRNTQWNGSTARALALEIEASQLSLHTEPSHRYLVAALLSFAILVLGLSSGGCTVGQTRFALGATLVADGVTTQSALSGRTNAAEGNPVLQKAPIPIMMVLSGVVALVAEHQIKNGQERQGKNLYRIASVVHGLAAAWNGSQLGKSGESTSTASAIAPAGRGTALLQGGSFAPVSGSRGGLRF